MEAIPEKILERAKQIRLLVTDIDGVLTDGRVWYTATGDEFQGFDIKDGLGIRLAAAAGIRVALVTGRRSEVNARRSQDLKVATLMQGVRYKAAAVRELAQTHGLQRHEIAAVGDDLNDFPSFDEAGLTFAPCDASQEVLARVDQVLSCPGGHGAVREVVEILLEAQGVRDAAIATFLQELQDEHRGPLVP